MKKNIILIGMPGVGKSTVGVVLAKVMGYQFIDADLVIQEKEGKLLLVFYCRAQALTVRTHISASAVFPPRGIKYNL